MKAFLFSCAFAVLAFAFTPAAFSLGTSSVKVTVPATRLPASAGATNNYATQLLLYEGESSSRSLQQDAIDRIQAMITTALSAARSDQAVYSALVEIALSGTEHPVIESSGVINSYPLLRMQACRELGMLGGAPAVHDLMRVIGYENDPIVLSEIAYQLGRLGRNPNNEVADAIVYALRRTVSAPGESIFAYSALASFQALAKSTMNDPSVISEISTIRKLGFGEAVRREAASLLSTMIAVG